MLSFKPFKGVRAKEEDIQYFPLYPPEIYTEEEIRTKLREKKNSYIDIIKPTFFKGESPLKNRFKKVRKRYEEYINENLLEHDPSSIYIYEQKKENGEIFKGIIGLISADDFKDGKIKTPEKTNKEKQKVFTKFLDITYLQTNPVLLTYEANPKLDVMMELDMKSKPLFNITDEFGITHKIWRVDNRLKLSQFKETIEKLPALYLADGHYRMAAAIEHSNNIKAKSKNFLFDQNHQVMTLLASSHSLKISEYNRLIKSMKGMSKEVLFSNLEKHFTIHEKGAQPYFPSHRHHISLYLDGEFWGLYFKHELRGKPEGLGSIDTYLFNEYILEPIFNITNEKDENENICYIKGTGDIEGIEEIKSIVDSGEHEIGFGFYPPSFESLKKVSDLGLKIPVKSSYIEPKLMSGIIIFDMK